MDDERPPGEQRSAGGWLPPEPAGPEPGLGPGTGPTPEQTTTQGFAPPVEARPARPQPPPPYAAQGHAYSQPPPTAQQQLGWGQPPQPQWQPPPPGWVPPPQLTSVSTNGSAVAGFVVAVSALGLLVTSVGILWPATLVAAIVGIVYSRKGKAAVREGSTDKHGQLAQAGFVVGIVVLVLSLAALAGCVALVADSSLRDQLDDDPSPSDGFDSVILFTRLGAGGLGL